MRLEQNLNRAQQFLENVGYCRFSSFLPHMNQDRAVLVEMVSRLVIGIFAAISAYDLTTRNLPLSIRVVVHGTILSILASLGLSILLKTLIAVPEKSMSDFAKSIQEPSKQNDAIAEEVVTMPAESLLDSAEPLFDDDDALASDPAMEKDIPEPTIEAILNQGKPVRTRHVLPPSPELQLSPAEVRKMYPRVRRNLMDDFNRLSEEEEKV